MTVSEPRYVFVTLNNSELFLGIILGFTAFIKVNLQTVNQRHMALVCETRLSQIKQH